MAEASRSDEMQRVLKRSINRAMNAAAYSLSREVISLLLTPEYRAQITAAEIGKNAANAAFDWSIFTLIDGTAYTLFKPNLATFSRWVPFTVATATAAGFARHGVHVVRGNLDHQSTTGACAFTVCHSVGFNVGHGLAKMVLPPFDHFRGAACLALATAGACATTVPVLKSVGVPTSQIATNALLSMSAVPLDRILYTSAKQLLRPLAMK